jgi:spore germination cell wall hydrolase CwlJ-like protein
MDIQSLEMDVVCYASAAYHEGSTKHERIAIINTIRNRLNTGRWGNSVCGVVYAHGQFIGVTDPTHEPVNEKTYLETKLLVIDTVIFNKYANPIADAIYFHDDSMPSKAKWYGKHKKTKIGRMTFY